jgi:hypothetical protein
MIMMVDSYIVKPDRLAEYTAFLKKIEEWLKRRPEVFKEAKSHKFFSQMIGGKWGAYVEMWEFESLADFEKCFNRAMQDKDFMTNIYSEAQKFILPGTESVGIWTPAT